MNAEQEAYDELSAYSLMRGDATFMHQHVVDAFAVQYSDEHTKPIKLTFGLVGLHLKIEKQFSGRRVQLAHMQMARKKQVWPEFDVRARPIGVQLRLDRHHRSGNHSSAERRGRYWATVARNEPTGACRRRPVYV